MGTPRGSGGPKEGAKRRTGDVAAQSSQGSESRGQDSAGAPQVDYTRFAAEILKQQTASQSVTVDNTEVPKQNATVSGNVSHTATPNTATSEHDTSACNSTTGVVNLIDQLFFR